MGSTLSEFIFTASLEKPPQLNKLQSVNNCQLIVVKAHLVVYSVCMQIEAEIHQILAHMP